jgi:pimeloyl-ACP methyl ester carboxylesterase
MPRITTQDLQVYYEDAGSGEPLILITGLGSDLQGWANQAPALASDFRVITYDNRGAGRTSAPDKPYSIEGMARDLGALMDKLDIESAHLLGWSMGGMIAQEFAANNPKRVKKLILAGTVPCIDGYSREVLSVWLAARQSSMSREEWVRFVGVWTYSPELLNDTRRYRMAVVNALRNPYAQQDHAFARQVHAILEWNPADLAAKIDRPTLILAGEDDIFVPARNAEKLAGLISGAEVQTLPGGHVGLMEYPKEYNAAITEFLRSAAG